MQTHSVVAELFHAGGRTDMMDNSRFSKCCESTEENHHVALFYRLNCYPLLNFIATVLTGNNYHDIVLEFTNITR